MFPLEFPFSVLNNAKLNQWVLDPFCGRGTTNFAARLKGINSIGIDSSLVACSIAESKFIQVKPEKIYRLATEIIKDYKKCDIPTEAFWEMAYNPTTLIEISKIRSYLIDKKYLNNVDVALRAIMLGILHGPKMKTQHSYLSNQMPRTFATKPDYSLRYWKRNKIYPERVKSLELIKRKAEYNFNTELPKKVNGRIIRADSRLNLENRINDKFDFVITSPPYYGMSTYEQDQWLRNWFLGGQSNVEYSNKKQVKHWSEKVFISDLAKVWRNSAIFCNPNASLIIRFGALPSKSNKTPSQLIKESLSEADCGWKISTIKNAGKPIDSNRQANQFSNTPGNYVEEIDLYARLIV
jgi:hypothetical protein